MLILERFEGNIAIIEDLDARKFIEVDRSAVPANAREGDALIPAADGAYLADPAATEQRRAGIADKMRRLGL